MQRELQQLKVQKGSFVKELHTMKQADQRFNKENNELQIRIDNEGHNNALTAAANSDLETKIKMADDRVQYLSRELQGAQSCNQVLSANNHASQQEIDALNNHVRVISK
jgi:FtsZ-binding cell division protein ZapB